MHKRMLRSALAAAFSAALAFGALSGLAGTKGDVARDSTWSTAAVAGDSTWVAPRDSTWVVTAADAPGDSTWVVTAAGVPGDSTWVAPGDSTWGAPADSTWVAES
ncbi:hypothetical protein GCM10010269_62510 [Streptomyces humidus]|uniref:5'-nucleotidase n=2 Tax=Streptomyces humidus TaxID=52259 RepID=A0A918G369_9ACTN|nr:hypothetical protein GCM10010269_62510 [Streptomyces humidus]